jgi:HSP20 family protein
MLGLTRRNPETALAQPPRPAMERWNPWGEFDRIRAEMDRLFGGLVGTAPRWTVEPGVFTPTVDLYETTDEVVVNAYLPGMSREDIHLEVMGNTLRLYGETKPAVPEKDVTVHLAEGTYGRFEFRYALPVEVKAEECRAAYRNGVLEVRLPKAESAKPKPVEIRVEG